MAVQSSSGAYLLGWTAGEAGDSWVFNGTNTISEERARASAFDGIGMAGFGLPVKAAAKPEDAAGDAAAASGETAGGDNTLTTNPGDDKGPERDPNTVPSPGGPIKIPGGG
jgi:hypothetical protein